MDGSQLQTCLKSDRYTAPIFKGVFPSNMLPKQKISRLPCGIIANTDPADKPGEHWVAFYIDINGKAEYFDSYGQRPTLSYFKDFLKLNSKGNYIRNTMPLQGSFSSVCGQYCLFYLLHRSRNWTMGEITGFFTRDKNSNDFFVNEFISDHFDLNTKISDTNFMLNQISRAFLPGPSKNVGR